MRSKARSPRIPRKLLRGQKLLDGISGEEIYQRDASTRYQRGMWMHKKNYDYLTTQQMEEMLQDQLTSSGISYQSGQGIEYPNYANLPFYENDNFAYAAGLLLGMPYNGPDGFTHVGDNPAPIPSYAVEDGSGNIVMDGSGNIVTSTP